MLESILDENSLEGVKPALEEIAVRLKQIHQTLALSINIASKFDNDPET
jgi:hypothetical protein